MPNRYIIERNFDKSLVHNSERYGEYKMRRIITVNMLDACRDKELDNVVEYWTFLLNKLCGSGYATITIKEEKVFDMQTLSNFDVYTTICGDNSEWKDPQNQLKTFPLGVHKKRMLKILEMSARKL